VALLVCGWFLLGAGSMQAKVAPEVKEAREHYQEKRYQQAKEAYTKMLQSKKLPAPQGELYYGLGAAELQLKEYDTSVRSFSDALKSHNPTVQKPALRGLATALYNQGEVLLKSDLESTIKAWTDSRDHFDTAMSLEKDKESDAYRELSENRALVQKRLDEVKQMLAEQKARQQGGKQKQKQQGQGGEGDPEDEQEGEGQQQSPQDQDGGQGKKQKPTDALKEGKDEILEGDLRAGEAGKPTEPKEGQPDADHMRNDSTGYTPFEARSMLKMYSDEQKSTQYLMRRERALGGKDY
jgi:Ca-activated chloride channel family protein